MTWFICKQPNGTYARFSSIVDDFTHLNMTEAEAFEVCRDIAGRSVAEEKIKNAKADLLPYSLQSGTGLSRWNNALKTIREIHGADAAQYHINWDIDLYGEERVK